MDQLSEAEIALARDAFSLNDPGRKGKISASLIPNVIRSIGFNATAAEISVSFLSKKLKN